MCLLTDKRKETAMGNVIRFTNAMIEKVADFLYHLHMAKKASDRVTKKGNRVADYWDTITKYDKLDGLGIVDVLMDVYQLPKWEVDEEGEPKPEISAKWDACFKHLKSTGVISGASGAYWLTAYKKPSATASKPKQSTKDILSKLPSRPKNL